MIATVVVLWVVAALASTIAVREVLKQKTKPRRFISGW